jgi:hypothetical protein
MPSAASPARARISSGSTKTRAKSVSLPIAVVVATSAPSAIAGSGLRFSTIGWRNSTATCAAVAHDEEAPPGAEAQRQRARALGEARRLGLEEAELEIRRLPHLAEDRFLHVLDVSHEAPEAVHRLAAPR